MGGLTKLAKAFWFRHSFWLSHTFTHTHVHVNVLSRSKQPSISHRLCLCHTDTYMHICMHISTCTTVRRYGTALEGLSSTHTYIHTYTCTTVRRYGTASAGPSSSPSLSSSQLLRLPGAQMANYSRLECTTVYGCVIELAGHIHGMSVYVSWYVFECICLVICFWVYMFGVYILFACLLCPCDYDVLWVCAYACLPVCLCVSCACICIIRFVCAIGLYCLDPFIVWIPASWLCMCLVCLRVCIHTVHTTKNTGPIYAAFTYVTELAGFLQHTRTYIHAWTKSTRSPTEHDCMCIRLCSHA
jgi:hypothetical protein